MPPLELELARRFREPAHGAGPTQLAPDRTDIHERRPRHGRRRGNCSGKPRHRAGPEPEQLRVTVIAPGSLPEAPPWRAAPRARGRPALARRDTWGEPSTIACRRGARAVARAGERAPRRRHSTLHWPGLRHGHHATPADPVAMGSQAAANAIYNVFGWWAAHHSRARTWVQAPEPSISVSRTKFPRGLRPSAGSFARQDSTSASSRGNRPMVRADGGAGASARAGAAAPSASRR